MGKHSLERDAGGCQSAAISKLIFCADPKKIGTEKPLLLAMPSMNESPQSVVGAHEFPAEPSVKKTMWFLYGQLGNDDRVRHVSINVTPFRIGRRIDLALSINKTCVSKEHAELEIIDDELFVKDLGSTNGTFINGQRVSQATRLSEGDLLQIASVVFRVGREVERSDSRTMHEDAFDRAVAMMQFDRLLNEGGVIPFYQPIVTMETKQTIGYEVLGRSRLFGLRTPTEMFAAATQLNVTVELSELLRLQGVSQAQQLPANMMIFLNTHPSELANTRLVKSLAELRESCPDQPLTIEIHEGTITDSSAIVQLKKRLDELHIRLAFDDFGVGRSRLVELSEVRPDVVKFDMLLTRDIHRAPRKRQEAVALISQVVNDLGITSLAEGVETEDSHKVLCEMNFKLGQGFYYGRPATISRVLDRSKSHGDSSTEWGS